MSQTIEIGSEVILHFTLAQTDGSEAISTFGDEPTRLTVGDGSLTEGLENTLIGLKTGDKQSVIIQEKHAFGPRDEAKVQLMGKNDFPDDMELEPGLIVAFQTPQGGEVAGIIAELTDEQVTVDFNHPLAGRDVVFTVEILEITPPLSKPTSDIIDITKG